MFEKIGKEKVISWYWLEPYNKRKSFYRKAAVLETDTYYYLLSYETLMCRYNKEKEEFERTSDAESMTTSSHLKSFYRDISCQEYEKKKFYKLPLVKLKENK